MVEHKAQIEVNKCTDCGECIRVCPQEAIYSDEKPQKQFPPSQNQNFSDSGLGMGTEMGRGFGMGMGRGMGRGLGRGKGRGLGRGPRDGRGGGRGGGGKRR
jgi:ferredoxin